MIPINTRYSVVGIFGTDHQLNHCQVALFEWVKGTDVRRVSSSGS